MEGFNPSPIFYAIVGALVGMIIGWVIGFFDSNQRTEKKIQAAESNAQIALKEAEDKIAQANQQLAQIPQTIVQDEPGLLRLKNDNGIFALEMDGAPVRGALPAEQKKRLIELLTVIRPYLEGGLPPQVAAAPRPAQAPPEPVIQPAAPAPTPPVTNEDAPKSIVKTSDKKAMAALSMVGQIDAVLQERLLNTSFAKRGIRVVESSAGGVRVEVGLEKFEMIDDVPYADIKTEIRAAITEWEKKFTPGL